MKKWKLIFSTMSLCLLLCMSAWAATAQISFSDPTADLNSEVNVTMKVKSPDGTLSRADITLNYDTTALEFVSGTDAEGGAGSVRVHGASNGSGTDSLEYNLKFRTLSAGQGTIQIGTQEVYDTDESIVDITHNGSSTVSIRGASEAAKDASLKELTLSSGELSPAFSGENTNYEVLVGTDVSSLAINAVPADSAATVSISGNEELNIGENMVVITVTAADGGTQTVYNLTVRKQEGVENGENPTQTATTNEGVKLSAKEKTITIMNPGSDVTVPEGFAESTIDIDGHQVRGWVWKADQEHEYCIVYAMNDAGELNFYRYDLMEKTLQRYFADPVEAQLKKNAEEYPAMEESYNTLVSRYNTQFILSCVLGILSLILAGVIVVLLRNGRRSVQSASLGREEFRKPEEEEDPIKIASSLRPAVKRTEIHVEDLEKTRAITEKERKEILAGREEDDLDATKAISDIGEALSTKLKEDTENLELTKAIPRKKESVDLEIEEL